MEYEFFIDLFFLADLLFNLQSLFLTAFLIRRNISIKRLLVGAIIGSIWNCFIVVYPVLPPYAEILFTTLGIGSIMTASVFSIFTLSEIVKADMALFTASAVVGGAVSFLREHLWLTDWESMVLVGIICLCCGSFFRQSMQERAVGKERYQVWLYYCGRKKEFLGLADSGNRLRTPESGKPVSIVAQSDCVGFCDHVSGGFYIPYRAVGTREGVLFAMTFEKMEIWKDGEQMVIDCPVVAITKEQLSADNTFSILLPEEYIRG